MKVMRDIHIIVKHFNIQSNNIFWQFAQCFPNFEFAFSLSRLFFSDGRRFRSRVTRVINPNNYLSHTHGWIIRIDVDFPLDKLNFYITSKIESNFHPEIACSES